MKFAENAIEQDEENCAFQSSYGAKTGLSAVLGDVRVQPVDVSNEARINASFNPAEKCQPIGHLTIPQDLHRDSAEAMRQQLRGVVIKEFGSNSE